MRLEVDRLGVGGVGYGLYFLDFILRVRRRRGEFGIKEGYEFVFIYYYLG